MNTRLDKLVEIAVLCCTSILLSACGGRDTIRATAETSQPSCTDFYQVKAPYGIVTNNTWNKTAAGNFKYSQCIVSRNHGDTIQYGWTWNWPSQSHDVFAYPQVVVGRKPWNGGQSTHPGLPIKIGDIQTFKWSYDTDTSANGSYNLATTMWLTNSGATDTQPNPADINTELMIWTMETSFKPLGVVRGTVTIGAITFEVWEKPTQTTGAISGTWTYIAYRAIAGQTSSTTLDIKAILSDAAARGLIKSSSFVADIELGNEIMSGSGQTWINSLSATVN